MGTNIARSPVYSVAMIEVGHERASEERRRFRIGLIVVLGLTAVVWIGYQLAQPAHDPRYDEPGFDSAYYLAWSDAILSGD